MSVVPHLPVEMKNMHFNLNTWEISGLLFLEIFNKLPNILNYRPLNYYKWLFENTDTKKNLSDTIKQL